MKYILILTLLISQTATAADARKKSKVKKTRTSISQPAKSTQSVDAPAETPVPEDPVPTAESASTQAPAPKTTNSRLKRWSFIPQGLFWQEDIEAEELGEKADFHSQLMGLSLGMTRTHPIRSKRWVPFYSAAIAFGTLKSAGASAGHIDSFKNQPWYMIGGDLGISYRPSSNSEIRLLVPAHYRIIQWKSSRSTLEMGQKGSYTTGLGIVSATRVMSGSYIVTGFTHFYQWKATLWHAGFEFVF